MEYSLTIENAPETIPGGTAVLLVHPSTVETDRIDTEFLKTDVDDILIISTRTTAREVRQKLEHYEVDEQKATILDALSVERGYTRRKRDDVRYVSSPDDLDGIVEQTREFLAESEGKSRLSLDSLTEMIYYAEEERTHDAVAEIQDLLVEHDAVGLFHLAEEVHDERVVDEFRMHFDIVLELDDDGALTASE